MEESWIDAIKKVLLENREPMHYEDITQEILERELRTTSGATPAFTVNSIINSDIQQNGDKSLFVKTSRGEYTLRNLITREVQVQNGLIKCYGMYWKRNHVIWKSVGTKIYGKQVESSKTIVDFSEQRGIYLLHDNHNVVYVGEASRQPIVNRLNQHTKGKKSIRWDRFSWFGFLGVADDGSLLSVNESDFKLESVIKAIEGILIECLEPRLNMRSGDLFGTEFQQEVSEEIKNFDFSETIGKLKNQFLGQ